MFKRISFVLMLTVFLTACGPKATPTMSAADVQGTALSAAFTMVAATQQAMPTATPVPPTAVPSPTPLPTFTPQLFIPTLPVVLPSPTTAASGDCLHPLDVGAAGFLKNVRIENTNVGTATLSLNLWKPNEFGECGVLSYVLKKNSSIRVLIPAGYWFAYAWVHHDNGKDSTPEGEFYLGPSRTTDLLRLVIREDVIGVVGP